MNSEQIYLKYLFTEWNANNMSQSQHFMTDLLVSSLMTDGGLEISLQAAVKGLIYLNLLVEVMRP